jgi:hypothetical protein
MSTAKKKPHARGSERGAKTKATKKFMATIKSGLSKGKLQLRTAPAVSNGEAAAIKAAANDAKQAMPGKDTNVGVGLADFYALMPSHDYIFVPSRETWPASSVNSRIRPIPLKKKNGKPELDEKGNQVFLKASTWLDQNRPVEMMTWAPGLPLVVADKLISDGGWIERQGVSTFNLYRPPSITLGDAKKAKPWTDLVRKVYPDDADEIFNFFAHRRQRPEEKINHALVLGGEPGIGKDTMLEALKQSVGPWNFKEVSPQDMMGPHNDFMRSTALRISKVSRPWRGKSVFLLRSHKDRHGNAARCGACQHEIHAAALRAQRLRRDLHHQLQDQRHLPARR